jgi:Leucine-rich repeat (LRR) protein
LIHLNQTRRDFYDRLKFTILDSTREELDEILRTLIKKDNARDFYEELFYHCYVDSSGELVRQGFFEVQELSVPLEYAMYTLLAYAPSDFPLKHEIRSIRFLAPPGRERQALRFPRRLDYFPRLEQLGVVGWASAAVPRELSLCTGLKYLSLRDNCFTSIPDVILDMPRLTYLDMSMNRITELPYGLNRLIGLKNLSLRGNLITKIPPSVASLGKLELLDLSCNRINEVCPELRKMKNRIDLSYNDLSVEEEYHWDNSLPSH